MAVMAVILLASTVLGFGSEASTMTPAFRHGLWALMILLWLVVLATGGGLLLNRRVRSLMNDEVALANRSRAIQAGFWAAILFAIGLYFLSMQEEISVFEALRILVNFSIATALIRYAWLELR